MHNSTQQHINPCNSANCCTTNRTHIAMSKTRAQVREEFASRGWSISTWARDNSYSPNMVIAILADNQANPRIKCLRGDAHNIAVALGLKEGVVSRRLDSQRLAVA